MIDIMNFNNLVL